MERDGNKMIKIGSSPQTGPAFSHRGESSTYSSSASYAPLNDQLTTPLTPIGNGPMMVGTATSTSTLRTCLVTTIVIGCIVVIALAVGITVPFALRISRLESSGTIATNVGTLGYGTFDSKVGHTLQMRNIAAGTYTTVTLDSLNNNIVTDVNLFALGGIEILTDAGLLGGQLIQLGGSANLSLAPAQSFTMLTVSGDTLLGNQTSCVKPMLPSCIEIGGRGCDTPLQASCVPQTFVVDTITVTNLIVTNSSTIAENLIISNQTVFDDLHVINVQSTGLYSCAMGASVGNECLNLGGYICPMGVPLSESCIPASLVQYDMSVTNNLNVNQVTCLGGPLSDICVGGTDAAVANALMRRDALASFAAHIATLDAVQFPATTTNAFGLNFGGDAILYRVAAEALRTDTDLGVRHLEFRNLAGAPTITMGTGAGTGALGILAPGANDCNFKMQIIMGTSPQSVAMIFRATYATPFTTGYIPRVVFSGAFSVNYQTNWHISPPYINTETETYFEFYQGQNQAFIGGVQYNWNFMIC